MKKVRILRGQHFSFMPRLGFRRGSLRESWKFGDSCQYDHGNENQADWNKLTGISWTIFAQKCSLMVGWRWNLEKEVFELNVYAHDRHFQDGRFVTPAIFEVNAGQIFTLEIYEKDIGRWAVIFESFHSEKRQQVFIPGSSTLARLVNCWFGGNEAAPHDMELWRGDFFVWGAGG